MMTHCYTLQAICFTLSSIRYVWLSFNICWNQSNKNSDYNLLREKFVTVDELKEANEDEEIKDETDGVD